MSAQRKRAANTSSNSEPQATHYKVLLSVGVKEEEPKPAKRHKPLFICKKTTSEPTSQACSSNCDTSLSQESMVSPPLPVAALHTSSASSSLLASPLEPPSSQHTMVRWGPMSPAFLIKDSRASLSPPLRGHHRAPPPPSPAQQGRRKRMRPEKTAQLLDALTALIRAGSASEADSKDGEVIGLAGSKEGNPPSAVREVDNDDMRDEDFHLEGLGNDSELLADLLNASSTSWENLHPSRLEESDGKAREGVSSVGDVTQSKTSGMCGEPDPTSQEHAVAEDSLGGTEDEFWAAAEDYLASQEERGLGTSGLHSQLSSPGCAGESTQDEFDLLLSQADERHLQVFENTHKTPQRPV